MADAPSEEQIQAANKAEDAKWADDFPEENLKIPYKQEETTDEGADDKSKKEDQEVEENADEHVVEEYEAPAAVVTTEDPGEYKPADYSFEVTLKDGKTQKVSTPEEAEKLADDPDNFETPKQLMDFINKQNKMNRNLDKDYEKWESEKKTYDSQIETQKERDQTVTTLTSGFEYLIAKGLMPKLDPADAIADWSDPEVAKHPGVKEQIELINYMTKENTSREKAGIPVLASALDAYNAWQLETGRKQADKEKKESGEQRRAAGARVAGVSPAQQGSYVPKGIAVGKVMSKRGAAMWDD